MGLIFLAAFSPPQPTLTMKFASTCRPGGELKVRNDSETSPLKCGATAMSQCLQSSMRLNQVQPVSNNHR